MTMRWRDHGLQITTPHGVTLKSVEAFIADNKSWIKTERKRLDDLTRIPSPDPSTDQEKKPLIFYQGRPTRIKLKLNPEHKGKSSVDADDRNITIHLPADSRLNCTRILENWLKFNARLSIQKELEMVLSQLEEEPVKFSIRDQKSRWGSCSTARRMSFNWRLIMAPPLSLRYVVIHEAAHLHHHDHSPRFWQLVETLMPDYRHHQHWLRQHQIALFADLGARLQTLKPENRIGS